MADVLTHLETTGLPWGVVTNKPGFLTEPLLDALGLRQRSSALVSGDTLPERKPHPRPMLHAATAIGIDPDRALYIGDDARDIQAGRAAGMITIVARYGYIEPHESPDRWGADFAIDEPAELIDLIGRLNAGDA